MNAGEKRQDSFWKPSWGEAVCIMGVTLYIAVFFALQVRLYEGLHMGIADLGLFEQALYRTLHGEFFRVSVGADFHFDNRVIFADHFFPILLLVFPFYALFPHPYTLFFLQASMAGSGGLAIFLLARNKLQSEWMAVCFALSYLLYPPLQWATLNRCVYGFHLENFFPPLLLFALYFLEKRRLGLFAMFFLLALTVIEYYALLLACLGLYLFLFDKRNRRIGLMMFFLSTLWCVVATQWVIPYFRRGGAPFYYYVGLTPLVDAIRDPEAYLFLATPLRDYLFRLFAPLLFLPLLNMPLLATIIPNLLLNLSALAIHYTIPMSGQSHQVSPMIPVVFLSAVFGLRNLLTRVGNPALKPKLERYGSCILLCAALFFNYWFGPLPFSRSVEVNQFQIIEDKRQALKEAAALIPREASLSADFFVGPHFAQRKRIYIFPNQVGEVDFILVDSDPWSLYLPLRAPSALARLKASSNHELIYSKNNLLLFKKLPEPPVQHATEANFSGQLKLLGYTLKAEEIKPGDSVQLVLYWQGLANMETNYIVFTHLTDENERIMGQQDNPPVSGLYPTTEWTPGEKIVDRYEIATSPEIPPGEYSIEIGLYELDSGERLPVLDATGLPQDSQVTLGKVRAVGE
jgi:uncharacterized membrane protein